MEVLAIKQKKDNNKIDPDLLSIDHMMSRWELNPQKPEDSENLDQEWKTPKVANIMHKKIQQVEGTKDKERVEIPSKPERTALEHGRPPEKFKRKAGE